MADPQQFIIRKPGGKPLMTVNDVTEILFTDATFPSGTGIAVTEITDEASNLPWRVIRDDRTVAAVEDASKALAVLQELADDLTLWRLEFHTTLV